MDASHARRFFLEPQPTFQRRYEALRALFVDDEPLELVAARFGNEPSATRSMASRLRTNCRHGVATPFMRSFPQILRVDLEIRGRAGEARIETRYLITSLRADETSPERPLRWVRGHWSVENRLHFIKDRWWDEDRLWSIRPGLAERLAMMRDATLADLRLIPGLPEDLPIRARADHLGRAFDKALNFIGASI